MRIMGKALPDGGTKYLTLGGEFDIVRTPSGHWALLQYGQEVLRRYGPNGRTQCLRYLERWLDDEHGFAFYM